MIVSCNYSLPYRGGQGEGSVTPLPWEGYGGGSSYSSTKVPSLTF